MIDENFIRLLIFPESCPNILAKCKEAERIERERGWHCIAAGKAHGKPDVSTNTDTDWLPNPGTGMSE